MYPKFIELHCADDEIQELSVNIDSIADYYVDDEGKTIIDLVTGVCYVADETYEEVKELITASGCLINRADPRLDDKPLTMDDLMTMAGEPVWDVGAQTWMLVDHVEGGAVFCKCTGIYKERVFAEGEDLIRKPLYRMRRERK